MFERLRKRTGKHEPAAPAPAAVPSAPQSPATSFVASRTTSYPQGTEGPAAKATEVRTTSYRSGLHWSRRGYGSIN